MTWKKTDDVLRKRMNQHGIGDLVTAGQFCRQAESLYPGLFTAISFRTGTFHIKLQHAKQLEFKLIQGKLLSDLNGFAENKNMPKIIRFRLTIED